MAARVERLQESDAARWDAFVRAYEHGTPFHSTRWKAVVESAFGYPGHYLYVQEDGAITGVLALFLCGSRLLGRALVALPFAGTQPSVLAAEPRVQALLGEAAVALARELGAAHVELREEEEMPWGWTVRQSYVNVRLPLTNDPDEVWRTQVESRVRTKVRKARKHGLRVEWGGDEHLDAFFAIYAETMHRLGSPPHARALFGTVLACFPDQAELALVLDGDRPVAGALVMHDHRWFGFPWAASLTSARALYPNNLLYWALIERASRDGYAALDLGRSPAGSGTMHFKVQWGGVARPLWYHFAPVGSGRLPSRDASDPLMQRAAQIWRHLPMPVANRLGPALARLLP